MELTNAPKKKSRLTLYIIIALFAGIAMGFVLNKSYISKENQSIAALQISIDEATESIGVATDSLTRAQWIEKKKSLSKEQTVQINERDG